MMKKVPTIAVAALTLVLSGGAGFAEPPNSVTPNGPGVEKHEPVHLAVAVADVDLAALQGKGLRSAACTVGVKVGGYVLFGIATVAGDPFGKALGKALVHHAAAICV